MKEQIQLSESLYAACIAAGISRTKYVAQDADGTLFHYPIKPDIELTASLGIFAFDGDGILKAVQLDHPPYADNWQESLLQWVRPSLQVGKRYWTRDGRVTDEISYYGGDCFYGYRACIGGRMFYWQASGQWSNMGEKTRHDIVAEYKPTTLL